MIGTQRLVAIAMAFFLTGTPGRGVPNALGVIVQAEHASLGSHSASEGTTIFDGDWLSTGDGGSLRMVLGEAMLYLGERSSVIVHIDASGAAKQFQAELVSGAVVLSATAAEIGQIVASSARVRPVAEARGVVQVRLVAANELIVFAQRGPAEICYRGECATIPEGKSYRVTLDSSDDGIPGGQGASTSAAHSKALVMIAIGAAAAAGIAVMWKNMNSGTGTQKGVESPDRP
ncbi:MAG: hypothetical protein WA639_14925 [Candidatus Acidiferrum sp.]